MYTVNAEALAEVTEWNAYRLANEVGVSSPDSKDSAGAKFLQAVHGAFLSELDQIAASQYPIDTILELSDVYADGEDFYSARWDVFADLRLDNADYLEAELFGLITWEEIGEVAVTALVRTAEHVMALLWQRVSTEVDE